MGTLYVGTSGFAYPQWKGSFYPEGLSSRRMLEFYATRLPSVEINYTFRRDPTPAVIKGWRAQTPEGFRFVIKASMRLTHFWPLDPRGEALDAFLELIRPLGKRLGPVLFQTGPRFALDLDRLARFLDRLPPDLLAAFEFRHPSWEEARPLLADRGAAWVTTETNGATADGPISAVPFVYVRLRRTDYDEVSLDAWAKRLRPRLRRGDVYAFFKHEEGDAGPAWAAGLAERLSGSRA